MNSQILKIPLFLSNDCREKCIFDILELLRKGEYIGDNPNIPLYQTHTTLLEIDKPHWQYLKKISREIFTNIANRNPSNVFSFSYISLPGKEASLGNRWHTHLRGKFKERISAIYYLQVENENEGSMFDLGSHIFIPKVDLNTLYVFDPSIPHTSPYWNYKNNTKERIVLAIDADFI